MILYSASVNGFFDTNFNEIIPADAIEISDEYRYELLMAEKNGMKIIGDENGYPILIDNPLPTIEQLRAGMVVTKLKAKQNLKIAGRLNFVLDAMDDEPRDSDIRILWDESPQFHRLDATLVGFCKDKMGMTDEDIDSLFL